MNKIPTTSEQNAMLHSLINDLKHQVEDLTRQVGELLRERDWNKQHTVKEYPCLHDGLKPGDVHMIYCPCPKCSPHC